MARRYANIVTAVWRDDDFLALDVEEQRMYFLLLSQPDISAAGVLHLSLTRWSAKARNTSPESVMASLKKLAAARYVIFDLRTEELLVRSFVRWDGGYTNSKRKPAIRDAAQAVESPIIRRMLAVELGRLALPQWLPDALSDSPSGTTPESPNTAPDEDFHGIGDDLFSQGNRLSDWVSDRTSQSDGVVVTEVVKSPQPPNRETTATSSLPALTVNQRAKRITDAYAEVVKLCKWPAVNGVVIKAINAGDWADAAIHEALQRLAKEGRSVTVDTLRYELNGFPPTRSRESSSAGIEPGYFRPLGGEA